MSSDTPIQAGTIVPVVNSAGVVAGGTVTQDKKFWLSRTFWVNVISVAGLIASNYTKFAMTPEMQVVILGVINAFLRVITNSAIIWS